MAKLGRVQTSFGGKAYAPNPSTLQATSCTQVVWQLAIVREGEGEDKNSAFISVRMWTGGKQHVIKQFKQDLLTLETPIPCYFLLVPCALDFLTKLLWSPFPYFQDCSVPGGDLGSSWPQSLLSLQWATNSLTQGITVPAYRCHPSKGS